MANATLSEKVEAIYKNPTMLANAKDYLNMLAESEGTANQGDNGYNIMFRGGKIADYKAHPNQRHEYIDKQGRKGVSTAAGRYQFIHSTYQETAKKLGITDFSPESQDKVAIALMLERGVDFNDGADLATNVNKINNTWTSLTGSTVGAQYHSQRDPQFLLNAFNKSRTARGASPVTTKWGNTTYQSPADVGAPANAALPANIKQIAANAQSYLESLGLGAGYTRKALEGIRNKTYADSGYIPWQMYQGNKFTVSSNPQLTQGNLQAMDDRLRNTNPNVSYGVSAFGNGLHPTVAIQQPNNTVAIGTDVPTTIAVAPALSDGGVPVEDATIGPNRIPVQQTQLVEDTLQAPLRTAPQQPASKPLPTATPASQPVTTTAPVSKTVASDAPASAATTPLANNTGASQPTVSVTAPTAPTAPVPSPEVVTAATSPVSIPEFLMTEATPADVTTAQVLQVGGFQIPWATNSTTTSPASVPQFAWLTPDGARNMIQATQIKPQDMPRAPV